MFVAAGAAAFTVAAYAGWYFFLKQPDPAAQYMLETVKRGNVENIVTASGTLQPRDYVDVGAQVSGQLKKIHVDIGARVAKGDLLAEIDATVAQARVDASRAQLANLQAQLAERESQLLQAQRQFTRQQALMREDATTTEALQTAETALRSAQAQLVAIKAQIRQTESTLRGDEANLGYTKIYAPMAGTVVSQTARLGQTLNANQSAPIILRIADLSVMTVETEVSEADVGKLRTGMPVYFTTLAGQEKRWTSTLLDVQPTPTVTNNVVLYNARFEVPNPNGELMTQMTAQVYFVVASARDALLIPASAVQSRGRSEESRGSQAKPRAAGRPEDSAIRPRQGTVRVIGARGRIEEREVTLGVGNRVQIQVISGLEEGDRVIAGSRVVQAQRASGSSTSRSAGGPPFGPRL